jgi:hypothetical protein
MGAAFEGGEELPLGGTPARGVVLRHWDKLGDRHASPRDDDLLAGRCSREETGKALIGRTGGYGLHLRVFNPMKVTWVVT